jgi:hypothetical protein
MPPIDALQGTYWQAIQLPLDGGLRNRSDPRVLPSPFLSICQDVQFDLSGGIQERYPYGPVQGAITGGGSLANVRRIVAYGDELVLFTADAVYSWNAKLSAWVRRGTHLAIAVDEKSVCATNGDQIDGDRAELGNTVIIAWTEASKVYAAAIDKATGSILVEPTVLSGSIDRPRVIALSTRILIFNTVAGNILAARAVDPAAPGTAIAGAATVVLNGTLNGYYDVVGDVANDRALGASRHTTTTNYNAFAVTAALSVTTSVKARACDGPIAVSYIATTLQIVRASGTNIVGDLLNAQPIINFADLFTAQAIGTAANTPVQQIAAAHRSVLDGGFYRCYVFWSVGVADAFGVSGPETQTKTNWVNTNNALGTQSSVAYWLGIGSRAFDYNGAVYVWLTFGQLSEVAFGAVPGSEPDIIALAQNAFFLIRDDGFLCAKAAYNIGGGIRPSIGHLPGVALTDTKTYSWIGTVRRRIVLNNGSTTFAARTPHDITITFDSNAARRCARLGRTLYIAGGEVLQYDGVRLTEVGFHVYPWMFKISVLGTGNVENGIYTYKTTWRWTNAKGESERSTTASIGSGELSTGPAGFLINVLGALAATHKTMTDGAIAHEIWRTEKNEDEDAPFFLASSPDPTQLTNPNRYMPNVATTDVNGNFNDEMADDVLRLQEPNPENGTELEDLAPPAATIITATDTRLFLAGVAGDPDRVWYSKLRVDGKIASFHDTLTIDVPRVGGRITAVRVFAENVFVFRETAVYRFPGVGLDNADGGSNYGPAMIESINVGAVSDEAVALFPGGIVFKSRKGWQAMAGNGGITDISSLVSDYDAEDVLAIDVVETQRQVRVLTANRIIMWDYETNQWGTWSVSGGVSSCIYAGAHVVATATGTRTQLTSYATKDYGFDVETSWIKPASLTADAQNDRAPGGQGRGYVRTLQPLGENRGGDGSNAIRVRVAYDYDDLRYIDDRTWTLPIATGTALQVRHDPTRHRCEAFKVRLTATGTTGAARANISTSSLGVTTSGTDWAAIYTAAPAGVDGNRLSLAVTFEAAATGSPPLIAVRDHFTWRPAAQRWVPSPNTIGVRVACDPLAPITVGALEAGITAGGSALMTLSTPDPTPGKVIDIADLVGGTQADIFEEGAPGTPSGEVAQLTALGVEVGLEPGIYRRLTPPNQQ